MGMNAEIKNFKKHRNKLNYKLSPYKCQAASRGRDDGSDLSVTRENQRLSGDVQ